VRPNPGANEHRIYFGHRTEDIINGDETTQIPVADFVSCLNDTEPTDQEWRVLLSNNGYTEGQINDILAE
jgi:hypothetical protein